MQKYETAVDR